MILVAEDELALREVQVAYLSQAGFEVIVAASGIEALQCFEANPIDLVVLDINLPSLDGLRVARRIREKSHVPIIMVTARKQDMDELTGFEHGADDYLKKPFNPNILVARVRALLKRAGTKKLHVPPFVINPDTMTLTKSDVPIQLTAMQFSLLYKLMERRGVVLNREQLIDAAHAQSYEVPAIFDRTIDAHIKALRQKIEDDPAHPIHIQTIYGRGYRFLGAEHA